jgi:WD repeat-containing protein 48
LTFGKIREVCFQLVCSGFLLTLTVNLGKWVLRYLFAGLLDEEIRRDEQYRNSLTKQSQSAGGLNRASAPNSIALPQRDFGNTEDQKTPRAMNGRMPMMTPGMGIGLATPGLSLLTQKTSNQSNMSPLVDAKSPMPFRGSLDRGGDYFAARPPSRPGTPGGMTPKAPTTPSETDERAPSAEADKGKETPGLFGKKKFRMSFAGKRLNKPAPEAAKPAIEEKPKEESDSEAKVEEEIPYAGCFYGVVHQMRQEYAKSDATNESLVSGIYAGLPGEMPVLKPPASTTILIQEESHNSAGMTDLFEGRLSSIARQADVLEKVAPFWLGNLLLKAGSTSIALLQHG